MYNNVDIEEELKMKVFISWSGQRSNQLAEIMKKWIKQVIQSVEPFVSSQDLPKGTRWSSDIAKELQNTNFGILCVTKDNYKEPWLLFEAGALSKTIDKSYVVPLLFDVEPSDLQDSPLLQFQASSFEQKDMKKLIQTLNNSNKGDTLDEATLDEAFDVWYPKLESAIKEVSQTQVNNEDDAEETGIKSEQIMEEILDLTRTNQKLLMNPNEDISKSLSTINDKLDYINRNRERLEYNRNKSYKYYYNTLDELIHSEYNEVDHYTVLSIMFSLCKNDYPWLFENGTSLIEILKTKKASVQKNEAINKTIQLIDFTARNFARRFSPDFGKENYMLLRDISLYLDKNRNILVN